MEIEKERALQMQKLALKREAEQRELERKRKEEWARKRLAELEGQRSRERSALDGLRLQHTRLVGELQTLDQRQLCVQASIERQTTACAEMNKVIRTLQLSREVRLEQLRKAQGELNVSIRTSVIRQELVAYVRMSFLHTESSSSREYATSTARCLAV